MYLCLCCQQIQTVYHIPFYNSNTTEVRKKFICPIKVNEPYLVWYLITLLLRACGHPFKGGLESWKHRHPVYQPGYLFVTLSYIFVTFCCITKTWDSVWKLNYSWHAKFTCSDDLAFNICKINNKSHCEKYSEKITEGVVYIDNLATVVRRPSLRIEKILPVIVPNNS